MKSEVHMIKLLLRTHNNTDGNKLVIFSGIDLYYGDTYIIFTSFNCLSS